MLALATTQTIQGKAGEANKVTYTITGSLIVAGVGAYKVLAQGEFAVATGILYEVPASNSALISHILLSNTAVTEQTVTLYADGTEAKNQIVRFKIPANGSATFDRNGWKVLDEFGRVQQGVEGPKGTEGKEGKEGKEGAKGTTGAEGKEGKEGKEGTSKVKLKVEAREEHTSATFEIEPSATENTSVQVNLIGKTGSAYAYKVYVGGTLVNELSDPSLTEKQNQSDTYLVPPATKLKVEKVTGEVEKTFTQITKMGVATGSEGVRQLSSYNATEVLATGTTKGEGALQAGEEDKVTFTVPVGGGYYAIAAQVVGKNAGTGFGGAILKVDGTAVGWSNPGTVEFLTPNRMAFGNGEMQPAAFDGMSATGEIKGWRKTQTLGVAATPATGMGVPTTIFLAAGEHTVGLYLFNEDRVAGRIKERRLVVTGP